MRRFKLRAFFLRFSMFFISIFEKILLLLGVCAFSSLHSKNITDCFRIIAQENLCFLRVSKYFSCVWERHSKLFYFTFWSKPLFSSQNFFAWTSDFLFLGDFYLYPLKSPYVLRWRLLLPLQSRTFKSNGQKVWSNWIDFKRPSPSLHL